MSVATPSASAKTTPPRVGFAGDTVTTPLSRATLDVSESEGVAGTPLIAPLSVAGAPLAAGASVDVSRFSCLLPTTSHAVVATMARRTRTLRACERDVALSADMSRGVRDGTAGQDGGQRKPIAGD